MYNPKHFEETRVDVLHRLIREHAFAAIVTTGPDGLNANHIPLEIDPEPAPFGTLRGHVARANPLWKQAGTEVLVIFQGPSSYITPSWYATKKQTAKVVPTWNYAIVHACGRMKAAEDAAWLRRLLTQLTDHHESRLGRDEPWKLADAPDEFIERQMQAIVGIEIPITQLIGKWKVSQNRPPADREGVIAGLAQHGDATSQAMAELVRQYGKPG
jgi:transcriptional regulator